DNIPQLNGVVVYADNWGYNAKTGLYSLPTAPGSDFEMLVAGPNGSSVVMNDRIYTINRVTMLELDIDYPRYTVYDADTGEELFYKNYQGDTDWSIMAVDMDIDPVTGDVYAITFNKEMTGYQLSRMYFTDREVTSTLVSGLGDNWNAIAFDAAGQLYGISKTNIVEDGYWVCAGSALNKIDKSTGAVTRIGETGQRPEYLSSATIDKKSGRMFWTISPPDNTGLLAEVDLTTGEATVLKTFDHAEEVVGLYAPAPAATEGAPSKVLDMEASFERGSMNGKVSFTAPTTLYDGTPASGALDYEITANGITVATGATSFGARVEADITIPEAGEYKIGATVSNAAGKSPEVRTTLYIGTGVPEAPYATLSYRNGTMLLTWTEVEESVDGGYIDPAQVTYTVRRYPEGATVATGHSTAAFSEEIAAPDTFTSYYYGVTAVFDGKSSEEALSNRIALGEITPPFTATFDAESDLSGWTIIDANADRRMWMWSTMQNLRISYNQGMAMDDWAITPALRLEQGRAYRMSFDVYCDDPSFPERIEVKMGGTNTVATMEQQIVAPTEVIATIDAPMTVTATITPQESGTYFIGFHGISDADRYMMNLDNVRIESGLDTGAPAAVTNLTATADPSGAYKATISFTTPATSIAGGAIWQSFRKVELWRDGSLVRDFGSAEPNQTLSHTDNLDAAGKYTYTVYCYNLFGQGMPASATVYVGIDKPARPAGATIAETANEGEVSVSWTAVDTDINGNPIPASKVTYTIAQNNGNGWTPLFENLTGTSHTFQATEGAQDMVQYAVFAVTEGGVSEGVLTGLIPVGPAFKGLRESFPDARATTLWGTHSIRNAVFSLYDDESGIPSQDGDNGFMGMTGEAYDDCGALFTGKVSLAGMENPGVTFHTFNLASNDINEIAVGVKEAGAEAYSTVKTIRVNELCGADEWGKVSVSLAAYAGKTIQVQFLCTIKAYPAILIDNIEIGPLTDNDLAITGI
ncbi:MAG: choice-of-anchor J domain-containing protein, partial [Muribaculaceae bacterium]|nr:choice-of-anchor J domain-containing protein [Muribaculaceae bacterium]